MVITRIIGRLFGLRPPGSPVAPPALPTPAGLIGRGWSTWRHTALRRMSDRDVEPLATAFVAGVSWAHAVLLQATLDRDPADVATWARIGRDLDRYTAALRAAGAVACPPRADRRPSQGDLGRKPATPLPGGVFDYGAPYRAPERGLS